MVFLGNADKLEVYLETVYAAFRLFDEFYDFSAPSDVTMNLTLTNDGLHFSESVVDLIAAQLSGRHSPLGLAPDAYSYAEFKELYLRRVQATPTEIVEYVNARL